MKREIVGPPSFGGNRASLSEVTRRLSEQMRRSPETIRYTLKNFDAENDRVAIFPNHRGVLTMEDKRPFIDCILTEPRSRSSVRFNRTRTSIQRILLDMRHDQILELPLDYIYNEDFETPSREEEYLGKEPDRHSPGKVRVPAGLPSYLAAL